MRRALFILIPAALFLSPAFCQPPLIVSRGVVNAAGFLPQGLAGGAIAQGSVFSIFGRRLGPSSSPALSLPLQTTLVGVSVRVFQGATAVAAIPLFVSDGQVNAIMPSNAPIGAASVQVTFNNLKSNPAPVQIAKSAAGIFAVNQGGIGPGVLMNFVSADSQPVNSLQTSAKPGQVITLWATGLGPITGPDNVAPPAGNLPTKVEVFVGGQPAAVSYSGRSSCCAGVDQINFTVPDNAALGCWVPVMVRTGGTVMSNTVTMAISQDGSPCSEPANPVSQVFINGGRMAQLILLRSTILQDVSVRTTVEVASDLFSLSLTQEKGGPFAFAPFVSQPPAGACTLYAAGNDFLGDGRLPVANTTVRTLDAGVPFSLNSSKGNRQLVDFDPLVAAGYLGSFAPFLPGLPNQLYLDPGNYTIVAPGGADVIGFQAAVTVNPPFTWTNRGQTTIVDRSQSLTVNWSGAAPGQTLAVFGGNADLPTNSSAYFFCVAKPDATSLTIPAAILQAIPPTRTDLSKSKGVIYLGNMPLANATTFSANGLDKAVVSATLAIGKTVIFQ